MAFWRLLAGGAAAWTRGPGAVGRARGERRFLPQTGGGRALGVLFIGFLVPIVVALALRAHPRAVRKDPAALPDSVFIAVAVVYVFVRLVLTSSLSMGEPSATQRILMGALCAVVAVWAAVSWRRVDHPGWRRAYGAIAVFALAYGTLRVFANGLDGRDAAAGRMGGPRVVRALRHPRGGGGRRPAGRR